MKVIISPTARASLIEIGDFIARDSTTQARHFTAALRAKALAIGKAPTLFPLAPQFADRGIRRCVFGNYLIFYRIDRRHVTILDILNAARDIEARIWDDP